MPADPLSDILDLIDARCILSGGLVAGGPWVRHFAQPQAIKIMALVEGRCWLAMDEVMSPRPLEAGDVIIVNGRHALTLASEAALLTVPESTPASGEPGEISRHGEGRDFFMLGGHVAADPARQDLLLDVLPPLIHVGAGSEAATTLRWLLEHLARELAADRPGVGTARAQLAQLIFVQALRAYLEEADGAARGWLRALSDERIAPALRLMHGEPGRDWTLMELARASAMSRTSFAQRFKASAGISPLAYLTNWRMRLAERDLRRADASVAIVARRLGYTSESAFSNAFKRVRGVAPRRLRGVAVG